MKPGEINEEVASMVWWRANESLNLDGKKKRN